MANYKILSWEEIPAQIRVEDGDDEVQIELPPRFQQMIDRIANERGKTNDEAYLDGWEWGPDQERDGTAKEVAEAVINELEQKFPEE